MNRMRRIFVGAFAGALLTLAIHPASQSYVLAPLRVGHSQRLDLTPWIPRNLEVLPPPTDTIKASLWTQAGAERIVGGKAIDEETLAKLIEVSEAAAKGEPNNGYWNQIGAVFLLRAGLPERAAEAWRKASLAPQWDDYQSRRLARVRDELSAADGGPMAWHSAAAYFERSTASAVAIEDFSRLLAKAITLEGEAALQMQLSSLRNGRLLREWSRSVSVGAIGASLVDRSGSPRDTQSGSGVREKILAKFELVNEFRAQGMPGEALEVDEIFRTNDAWLALAEPTRAAENARQRAALSVLGANMPGVLIGIAMLGLVMRCGVWLLESIPKSQVLLRPPVAPAIGVIVGIVLYMQTGLVLAAVAVSMCFGFLAFEPSHIRKRFPERMSPAFRWTVTALATLFAILMGIFWIGITTPATELLPQLSLPIETLGGNTISLSLAALVLSLLLLAAPAWAIVDRIPTPFAAVFTLREFSLRLAWGGFLAGVLLVPVAVYVDGQMRESMDRHLANEPAVYLLREQ